MSDAHSDILNKSWADIPQPKVLPVGTWLLQGRNASFIPKKEDSTLSARVLFFYRAKEPMDDVNQDELAALGDNYDFDNNDIVKQFWVDRPKDWDAVRRHLELHGVEISGSIQDTLKRFKNTEVLAYLNTKTFTSNGESKVDNDPTSFAAV